MLLEEELTGQILGAARGKHVCPLINFNVELPKKGIVRKVL